MYLYSVCILILILLTMNAIKAKVRQKGIHCTCVLYYKYIHVVNLRQHSLILQSEIICLQ